MTVDELRATLALSSPPPTLPSLLRALWLDAHGDWNGAHNIAQEDESREAAWVHAYLHRKEGDAGNASYWYRRAARPPATGGLEQEWDVIASALLDSSAR